MRTKIKALVGRQRSGKPNQLLTRTESFCFFHFYHFSKKNQMEPLHLNLVNNVRCRIQPMVIFTILDLHVRRGEKQSRVFGTLVGEFKEGLVEVKNCYAVPPGDESQPVKKKRSHK